MEIMRRVYAAMTATGEVPTDLFVPDVAVDATGASPDIGLLGAQDAMEALRTYIQTFDDFHVEMEELIHADGECVVTVARDGGRIKGSKAEISNRFFHVVKFRDNRIASWATYTDRITALKAAGLSE